MNLVSYIQLGCSGGDISIDGGVTPQWFHNSFWPEQYSGLHLRLT